MECDKDMQPLPTENSPKEVSSPSSEGLDEDSDSDCQIIDSPSTSRPFKFKQTRVHDWVKSPNQSYKDNISFKYDLPYWVDKFADHFDYVKNAPSPSTLTKKTSGVCYSFRCKHCSSSKRRKDLNVRGIGQFMRHLKTHKPQYTKFIEENPKFVPKKIKTKK